MKRKRGVLWLVPLAIWCTSPFIQLPVSVLRSYLADVVYFVSVTPRRKPHRPSAHTLPETLAPSRVALRGTPKILPCTSFRLPQGTPLCPIAPERMASLNLACQYPTPANTSTLSGTMRLCLSMTCWCLMSERRHIQKIQKIRGRMATMAMFSFVIPHSPHPDTHLF